MKHHSWHSNKCHELGVGDRLERARGLLLYKGHPEAKSRTSWARALHIARSVYAEIVSGRKPLPGAAHLGLVLAGVRVNWVYTGKGPILDE